MKNYALTRNIKLFFSILVLMSMGNSACVVATRTVVVQQPAPPPPPPARVINPELAPVAAPAGNYEQFYNELSPYGQWINNPRFGYVWIPAAGPDFVPYSSNGYWVYSTYGWTWVSEYSWGWAVFHYGLWDYDSFYGWYWIPGNQWGPAWVAWRSAPGYYGWAPLTPEYNVADGNSNYPIPQERWVFVQEQYVTSPRVYNYYAPRSEYDGYMRRSTVINRTNYDNERHTKYIVGPEQGDVERATGKPVKAVVFAESSTPGHTVANNGQLIMYRPSIPKMSATGSKPIPSKIVTKEELKDPVHRVAVPQDLRKADSPNEEKKNIEGDKNRNNANGMEQKKDENAKQPIHTEEKKTGINPTTPNSTQNPTSQTDPAKTSGKPEYILKEGKVMVVKEGKMTPLEKETILTNGTKISTDGTITKNNGSKSKLNNGDHINADGMIQSRPR